MLKNLSSIYPWAKQNHTPLSMCQLLAAGIVGAHLAASTKMAAKF